MRIEQRIQQLYKKLLQLGYYPFQVKSIIHFAIGNSDLESATTADKIKVVNILEDYEKLANNFSLAYSK
ncbi:hypothetical protein [Pelosinus propionicus]|uniref:Uncharacterized protein n=1 Tax=Pelosinus propionicus DSM 13327 TaxID=1123291 RepID=A0A1I4NAM6_9FIRM|nr:hypothetical protein [Pelosinus propionicus]SFM12340.1 hypothetical protein SAMN04490355_104312 [Pelosinus propionicus DSM 13327]